MTLIEVATRDKIAKLDDSSNIGLNPSSFKAVPERGEEEPQDEHSMLFTTPDKKDGGEETHGAAVHESKSSDSHLNNSVNETSFFEDWSTPAMT